MRTPPLASILPSLPSNLGIFLGLIPGTHYSTEGCTYWRPSSALATLGWAVTLSLCLVCPTTSGTIYVKHKHNLLSEPILGVCFQYFIYIYIPHNQPNFLHYVVKVIVSQICSCVFNIFFSFPADNNWGRATACEAAQSNLHGGFS